MNFVVLICNRIYIKHVFYVKKMGFWGEKEAKKLYQKLPFYNVLIEKPKIKNLSNIDLLHQLPLYDELIIN